LIILIILVASRYAVFYALPVLHPLNVYTQHKTSYSPL
jgi:hypothetical protein